MASGILYNSWDAHYRQVSVLRFTEDGAALLSGSEDSGISVWPMSRSVIPRLLTASFPGSFLTSNLHRLLDDEVQNELPSPYCTLSDHTLPITDIICGVGPFPTCRALTSSVDHSVKVSIFTFDSFRCKTYLISKGLGSLFPHSPYDIPISKTNLLHSMGRDGTNIFCRLFGFRGLDTSSKFVPSTSRPLGWRGNRGYWWCWCRRYHQSRRQ